MNLGVNSLLQFGLDETREQLCRNILADLSVVDYVPFDSDTIGNPALDVGDILSFSGGQADSAKIACITSNGVKIDGRQTIKCVGKNPRLAQAKSKNDKNISGLLSQIEAGKIGTVLSAVAEIERENILVQTMEGRKQKAREGKWNGGQAPFGYTLDSKNSTLIVNQEEAEAVRIIFSKYINEGMVADSICDYLNQHGYTKKKVKKNELNDFARSFIMKILDNPVYVGKIAYGRNVTEKVKGSRDEYKRVKTDDYMVVDGMHEQLRQVMGAKKKLTEMLDRLDINDKHYDRKYQDMHDRLDILYDRISEMEDIIADIETKISGAYGEKITANQLYKILLNFDKMYFRMSDLEKKQFMRNFIEEIELYPEKQEDGHILKQLSLGFPVFYEGSEGDTIRLHNENTVETVCLLSNRKPDTKVRIDVDLEDYYRIKDASSMLSYY